MGATAELNPYAAVEIGNPRIMELHALVGPNASKLGGALRVELHSNLSDGDSPDEREATLTLAVFGFPRDSKPEDEFAFSVKITTSAPCRWRPMHGPTNFEAPESRDAIFQTLYTIATVKIREIVPSMGFGAVRLIADLRRQQEALERAQAPESDPAQQAVHAAIKPRTRSRALDLQPPGAIRPKPTRKTRT